MYTEVYIDVIFLMNFLMDYILLRLIGRLFFIRRKRIRYVLAAAAGALFSCGICVLPWKLRNSAGILLHGFCGMVMLRIGPGFRKSGLLIKGIVSLYLAAFLFGGFWEAVSEKNTSSLPEFLLLTAGIYVAFSGTRIWSDCFRTRMRDLYAVTIVYEKKKCDTCGLYDTGNLLCDPVTGKPVSVIQADLLTRLLPAEMAERLKYIIVNPGELENTDMIRLKPHFLPFRSVGEQEGLLVAITLDELCIHTPKEEVRISNPVLALQYGPSALGSEYEVLLNSRLL